MSSFRTNVIDSATFAHSRYPLEWLVEGLLVKGQPVVLGGPPKCLKTSIALDLAISLAFGTPFLGRFPTAGPARVLVLSGESGEATLQETATRVARAKGVDLGGSNLLWNFELPRLGDPDSVDEAAAYVREERVGVVVIDPVYLCLLDGSTGRSATNLFDLGPLLRRASQAFQAAGATPIFLHHTSKGAAKQKGKSRSPLELPDLSFSSFAEFFRQWVLVNRREPYRPGTGLHRLWLVAGGSAGQGGQWALDVAEGTLAADFGGRQWGVTLRDPEEVSRAADGEPANGRASKVQLRALAALNDVLKVFEDRPDGETLRGLKEATGLSWAVIKAAVDLLAAQGRIVPTTVNKPAGRNPRMSFAGWKLAQPTSQPGGQSASGSGGRRAGGEEEE